MLAMSSNPIHPVGKTTDVMNVLGVSRPTAIRLMENGEIPGAYRLGRLWFVPFSTLEYMASGVWPMKQP